MKCSKCGLPLPEDSMFCQYCGEKVEEETPINVDSLASNLCCENVSENPPELDLQESDPTPLDTHDESSTYFELFADLEESASATTFAPQEKNDSETTPHDSDQNDHNKEQKYCKRCGAVISSKTKRCQGCGKQYLRFKIAIPVITISLLCLVSLTFNVVQYIQGKNQSTFLADSKTQIETLQNEITSKNEKIDQQKKTISNLQNRVITGETYRKKAEEFDTICKELQFGNLGYAANNFRASESVIAISKSQKTRKFTLTANWSSGGTVSVDYSVYGIATVDFDKNSWTTSTTMTIEPWRAGVTAVTFSNDVDSRKFKVLIIVTE